MGRDRYAILIFAVAALGVFNSPSAAEQEPVPILTQLAKDARVADLGQLCPVTPGVSCSTVVVEQVVGLEQSKQIVPLQVSPMARYHGNDPGLSEESILEAIQQTKKSDFNLYFQNGFEVAQFVWGYVSIERRGLDELLHPVLNGIVSDLHVAYFVADKFAHIGYEYFRAEVSGENTPQLQFKEHAQEQEKVPAE